MKRKDKKLYKEILNICHKRWMKDHSIFDTDKNRYMLDLSDSFIFVYMSNGKIILSKNEQLKVIFRDTERVLMLTSDIEHIVNKLKYNC